MMGIRSFIAKREVMIAIRIWTFGKWWADHSAQRLRKLSGEFSPDDILKTEAPKPSRKFKLNFRG